MCNWKDINKIEYRQRNPTKIILKTKTQTNEDNSTNKQNTNTEMNKSPMSKITCNEISEVSTLTDSSLIKFEYSRNVIQGLLSDYVKEKIIQEWSFSQMNQKSMKAYAGYPYFQKAT